MVILLINNVSARIGTNNLGYLSIHFKIDRNNSILFCHDNVLNSYNLVTQVLKINL